MYSGVEHFSHNLGSIMRIPQKLMLCFLLKINGNDLFVLENVFRVHNKQQYLYKQQEGKSLEIVLEAYRTATYSSKSSWGCVGYSYLRGISSFACNLKLLLKVWQLIARRSVQDFPCCTWHTGLNQVFVTFHLECVALSLRGNPSCHLSAL